MPCGGLVDNSIEFDGKGTMQRESIKTNNHQRKIRLIYKRGLQMPPLI
jgi:hypothetical protein